MADANVKQEVSQFHNALHECDWMTQEAMGNIKALTTAATNLLALDVNSLLTVRRLLSLIQEQAEDIENSINSTAENHGASHTGTPSSADTRLLEQHRTLHTVKHESTAI